MSRSLMNDQARGLDRWWNGRDQLRRLVDLTEATSLTSRNQASLVAYDPLPVNPRAGPFPIDTDALLRDRAVYAALQEMNSGKQSMTLARSRMRDRARALRALLEGRVNTD